MEAGTNLIAYVFWRDGSCTKQALEAGASLNSSPRGDHRPEATKIRIWDGTERPMIQDEPAMGQPSRSGSIEARPAGDSEPSVGALENDAEARSIIETVVSPFHCLYQDALFFHTQSRLARSESEASRIARAALLLYVSSAESLVHQAALELGRPDLRGMLVDPQRPMSLFEGWRILPAIAAPEGTLVNPFDRDAPPWPQFAELVALRNSWAYPGPAATRRAYYQCGGRDGDYEPLQAHEVPDALKQADVAGCLAFPRTGLPRDPYALRPHHLDAARAILDAAIEALDLRMAGALMRGQRHRREPVQVVHPPDAGRGLLR
jgi:hypothetical protein